MAEKFGAPMISYVDLAKRQLHHMSERAAFLKPVAGFADVSWRILLLLYSYGDVRSGIPATWEKELAVPMHTLRRYLEMLHAHGFIAISGGSFQPIMGIALAPDKKRSMDELLSHAAQSGVLFPDNSDFG